MSPNGKTPGAISRREIVEIPPSRDAQPIEQARFIRPEPKEGAKLPKAWRLVTVGETGSYVNGVAFKPTDWTAEGRPIVRIQNLTDPEKPLNRTMRRVDPIYRVNAGDMLVSWSATLDAFIWDREPALLNQHIFKVIPDETVADKRFLFYLLKQAISEMIKSEHLHGSTMKHINRGPFLAHVVSLPPIEEQRRIVAEIEKQFTRLDAGVVALRRVQANLKRCRAAVLKAACEGDLIPTEGGWHQIPLGDLIGRIGQGWSPKCDLTRRPKPNEWAVITTTAVQSMAYVDNQGKPLPVHLEPRPWLEIKAGDFLMTRKGPRKRAGVACLVRETRQRLMVCDTVYRFRCDESKVSQAYLELALNSPSVVESIDRQKAGINESGVSLTHGKLAVVPIPLPKPAEQSRIVAEVERRLSVIDQLETTVSANLERTTRLRQSILRKAFVGDLVVHETDARPMSPRVGTLSAARRKTVSA